MRLSPREIDKLALHAAGSLAQKRLARGLRLNHPEACALVASVLPATAHPPLTFPSLTLRRLLLSLLLGC